MAKVALQGNECHTNSDLPSVGSVAPEFTLVTNSLDEKALSSFTSEYVLLYFLPSLDTGVCAKTTKELNEKLSQHDNLSAVVISADLPFAQQRFCKEHGLKKVNTLSLFRNNQCAQDYGVSLIDGPLQGLTTRATFLLDKDKKIIQVQLCDDIVDSPDFDSALSIVTEG